jgi:uncharacterized membrane protein (UPF0182 family)
MPSSPRRGGEGDREPGSNRGRLLLAIVLAVLVVLALSLRAIATFWTDYLWFDSLDLASVWQRLLSARVTLGAATTLVFFVLLWSNLVLADRLAPRFRPTYGPEDEFLVRYRELVAGRQRMVLLVVSLAIAIVPGVSASAQWREWLLFRFGGSFGVDDPQFGTDIGFYVFKLPFLTTIVDWVFGFLIVTTIAVAVLHYLNGAIRIQPLGERVTPNAKAHLSILLAAAAFTKAVDYYLRRFELVNARGDRFDGAGYTEVNASLPAIQLMILVSIFAGVLLLVNIRRKGWALPVIVLALWVVIGVIAGGIYPAFVQRFQVSPNELAQEREFIERNIEATRTALGLDVSTFDFDYDPDLTPEMLEENSVNIDNARLLDPAIVQPTFQDLQVVREYYTFRDVDVDRYDLDGTQTPVVISSRELNQQGVTDPTWEKLHLVFTHGYAAALAPANSINDRGEPQFLISGIPPRVRELPPIERPEIYHGEAMTGYSIVGTRQTELSNDNVEAVYDGESGVPMNSLARRAAFALRFGQIEPLISDALTPESKVIYNRDVVERVRELAPFLQTDPDPYPILIDGQVKYLVDAYTTSSNYPYAQLFDAAAADPASSGTFNYLRNSVKALVDAYDGTVTLYLTDELYGDRDPIVRAWAAAFPGLFTEEIPDEVRAHFRYPEFLFKTQTVAWGRYHQGDPATFFNNSDRWVVAPRPSDRGVGAEPEDALGTDGPIDPYYQQMLIGDAEEPEFVLTRPFVLSTGDGAGRNLTAIMVARNDPENYGRLEQVVMSSIDGDEVTRNNEVYGPVQANRNMVTYTPVAEYQTLVGRSGSTIRFGNILTLPVGDAIVYMRPIYAAEETSRRFAVRKVVVSSGEDVGFGDTLELALLDMFSTDIEGRPLSDEELAELGIDDEVAAAPSEPEEGDAPATTTTTLPAPDGRTPAELLAEADRLFTEADRRLEDRDLAGYEDLVDRARLLVAEAAAALGTATGVSAPGG